MNPENPKKPSFGKELEELINRHSMESGSNTPDFILANYLMGCLVSFNEAIKAKVEWYRKSGDADV